jgi:hypothetical protein
MTSFSWFVLVFLGLVVLALVVYVILIWQTGRAAQNPAYGDQPGLPLLDRVVKHSSNSASI